MRLYFVLAFILSTTFAYSQQNKGFSIGLNYSPNLDNFLFVGKNKEYFDLPDNVQQPHWGYTYGLTLKYMFNKRIGLETGLLFTKKGCTLEEKENEPNFHYGSSFFYTENYFSTEIPLKTSYKIIDAAISCSLNIGLNFSFTNRFKGMVDFPGFAVDGPSAIVYHGAKYINLREEDFTQNELSFELMSDKGYRNFNLIPSASLAVSYSLTDKISIGLEPTFRFSVLNQVKEKYESITSAFNPRKVERTSDTSQIFWNLGLNSTIYYSF